MANEKRLIELDALIDSIDWDNDLQKWTLRGEPEDIPTVEAAPVVYGRWVYEPIEFTYEKDIKCSVCGGYEERTSNYCPNCGAKMMSNAREN